MATINNKFQQRKPSVRPVSSKAVPPTSKADKAVAPSTPATPTKTGAPAAVRTEDQLRGTAATPPLTDGGGLLHA
mgnify:CR=1 FL=1